MGRILRFRAFDKLEKKWLFGYEYANLGGFHLIGEVTLMGELNSLSLEKWDDVEIMQYTDLKDKNGVEIYEGDILEGDNSVIYSVVFDKSAFCVRVEGFFKGDTSGDAQYRFPSLNYLRDFQLTSISVIGNIHEHRNILS